MKSFGILCTLYQLSGISFHLKNNLTVRQVTIWCCHFFSCLLFFVPRNFYSSSLDIWFDASLSELLCTHTWFQTKQAEKDHKQFSFRQRKQNGMKLTVLVCIHSIREKLQRDNEKQLTKSTVLNINSKTKSRVCIILKTIECSHCLVWFLWIVSCCRPQCIAISIINTYANENIAYNWIFFAFFVRFCYYFLASVLLRFHINRQYI